MAEPFTASFIAAQCALGMAKGLAGKAAAAGAVQAITALRDRRTPEGVDVLRATHSAFVRALKLMAEACSETGGDPADHFSAEALKSLANDPEFSHFEADDAMLLQPELERQVRAVFLPDGANSAIVAAEAVITEIEKRTGDRLTPAHRELFRDGSIKHRRWADAFQLFFADIVKEKEPIFRAIAFERLNHILAYAEEHRFEIRALRDRIDAMREEMRGGFNDLKSELAELRRAISAEAGVPLATLEAIARAFGELQPNADLNALESYLRAKAQEYHRYRERAQTIEVHDNLGRVMLDRAQEAVDAGRFEEADSLLAEAEAHDEEVARELRLTADQRDVERSLKRSFRGDTAQLQGDYGTAVAHYDAAAEMLPALARRERLLNLAAAAAAVKEWGERFEPEKLVEAVRRYRAAVRTAETEGDELLNGLLNDLGNALGHLARLESGTAAAEEAVAVYQRVLAALNREQAPREFAGTQCNLANILFTLGSRQEGTELLEQAVTACLTALEVFTRDEMPEEWAWAQATLGNAFYALGERDPKGESIDQAVAAYRQALAIYSFEENPFEWAFAQNNLGAALQVLGAQRRRAEPLREAVAAYRAATAVYTRDRLPLDWAMTQNNLGNVLRVLGDIEGSDEARNDSIEAFRAALQVYTRERHPVNWALTQNNLGAVLSQLGWGSSQPERLEEAEAAFRASLEVRTRRDMPLDWAYSSENLAMVLVSLALLTGDPSPADEAAERLRGALEIFAHPQLAWNRQKAERGLTVAEGVRDALVRGAASPEPEEPA